MNRLWVRLAAMITLVFCLVFLYQNLELGGHLGGGRPELREHRISQEKVDERFKYYMLLALLTGLTGGVLIAWVVNRPVQRLNKAALDIMKGDLSVRVRENGPTELRNLARSFNKMVAARQEMEAQRQAFMADISHELRTPLTVLHGSLRAALDKVYLLDEAGIAGLLSQTQHLVQLVNDLSDLSLSEAGNLVLDPQVLDLAQCTDDCVQAIRPLASEHGIDLAMELESCPSLKADPRRIRQILFNILVNAVRYSPRGTRVQVRLTREGSLLAVRVTDQGAGLTPEHLSRLFTRFFRADASRSRTSGGTGLGLAISRNLARVHGGDLRAESPGPGKGSTFILTLPLP